MEIFVARQPIFDRKQNIFAYELLFREGELNNSYAGNDGDQATAQVIVNSVWLIGLNTMTNGKRAFINFTENYLTHEIATVLPQDQVVVEILESVEPTPEVIDVCTGLREQGFLLALDDFAFEERFLPLLEIADIVKIDFTKMSVPEQKKLFERYRNYSFKFLAAKVETQEQFAVAMDMGYTYFQGYFFSKPIIVKGQDIPSSKLTKLRALQEVTAPNVDLGQMEQIIQRDVSLSYKLLTLVNSSAFGLRVQVRSIRRTLMLLGTKEVAKWVSLMLARDLGANKNNELVSVSILRARFFENIMKATGNHEKTSDAFLMGMFSLIDALLDRPMKEVLNDLPLADEVRLALTTDGEDLFQRVYGLAIAYERGDWDRVSTLCQDLNIVERRLPSLHLDALVWAKELEVQM